MTVIVRDLRTDDPEDVAALLRVRRAVLPFLVVTEDHVRFRATAAPPAARQRVFVAESRSPGEEGLVLGVAEARVVHDSPVPGQASVDPQVDPAHTSRGAGTALLREAERHLRAAGATDLYAWGLDEPRSRGFAERHGYRPGRTAHFQRLDLTTGTLPDPAPLPAGVVLRTAASYAGDPRPLFAADAEVTADEPSDIGQELTDYDDWLRDTWQDPLLNHAMTSVAEVDGQVAAFSLAHTDGSGRYWSGMTGTRRAYRGRGLAKLAKADSLRRARAAGVTDAFTGNDAENAPMLAVNRWLGYARCATEVRHIKALR